jgi:hypothetical protein
MLNVIIKAHYTNNTFANHNNKSLQCSLSLPLLSLALLLILIVRVEGVRVGEAVAEQQKTTFVRNLIDQ